MCILYTKSKLGLVCLRREESLTNYINWGLNYVSHEGLTFLSLNKNLSLPQAAHHMKTETENAWNALFPFRALTVFFLLSQALILLEVTPGLPGGAPF